MNLFREIWKDIKKRQNLDLYLTLVIALTVSILGITGVSQEILFSAILAVLALLSFNLLQNRREDEELMTVLERLDIGNNLSDRFFQATFNPYSLRESVMVAREAIFWGVSLSITVPVLDHAIEEGLRQGLTVKFLVVRPDSSAIKMAAFRNWYRRNDHEVNSMSNEILFRLSKIETLSASWPGSLEVRTVDYLPPYIILATDPHLPSGSMLVYLTSFRTPKETRPGFSLTPTKDPHWFEFFKKQFEEVWKESQIVNLSEFSDLQVNE